MLALFAAALLVPPDGARLHADRACYTIFGGPGPTAPAIGLTWQT